MTSSADLAKERIREILDSLNWGTRDLGRVSGVDASVIHRWLNGPGAPSLDNLDKVCSALKMSPSDLIRPDPKMSLPKVDPRLIHLLEQLDQSQQEGLIFMIEHTLLQETKMAAKRELSAAEPKHRKKLPGKR